MKNKFLTGVVCIDLDGTLSEMVDDPGPDGVPHSIGDPIPDAKEGVEFIKRMGYRVVVWSARPEHQTRMIREWLELHAIPFDGVNTDADGKWVSKKPVADLYIDDRAYRFNGSWPDAIHDVAEILRSMKA